MQIRYIDEPEGSRRYRSIARIRASSRWKGTNAAATEADRLEAVRAVIREAEDYDADAIVSLDFGVDRVGPVDVGGGPLRRIAATGIAVKFDEAA